VWETERGAPLLLFAIPDKETRSNRFEVKVPKLASLILTHDANGEIKGMNAFGDAHPPALPLFFAFRIMVGVGMLMLAASWLGGWLYWRAKWQPAALPRVLLWLFAAMTFSGWVATVAGWYVSEIGRQPFIVYGLVRTADVVSKVPSSMIGLTLALYVTLYLALITAYVTVLKYMAEKPDEVLVPERVKQAALPTSLVLAGAAT
jgi:cytochrome d ubiquinol oxidase subunit I